MNNYISQYYSEPSSDMGIPDPAARVITAIDVHLPTNPSQLPSTLVSAEAMSSGRLQTTESSVSEASSIDCSSTVREASTSTDYPPPYSSPLVRGSPSAVPNGSNKSSPELEHRLNIYNKNQERALHGKALIQLQSHEPLVDEKHRLMEPLHASLKRLSKT
uniref:Uncharacterized protein n=1 Tax=Knipowitschia caucasica TaxID=637954 RepID=A0AAV2LH56_KNICA